MRDIGKPVKTSLKTNSVQTHRVMTVDDPSPVPTRIPKMSYVRSLGGGWGVVSSWIRNYDLHPVRHHHSVVT